MSRQESDELTDVSGVVYGVRVHGRLPAPCRQHLWPWTAGSPRPPVELAVTYRELDTVPAVEEVWESRPGGEATPGRYTLARLPDGFTLTVAGDDRGLFRCTRRSIAVEWSTSRRGLSHHLFAYALPLWLESRGVPVLHGGAVAVGGRAVGFVGPSGGGKSVLCAELLRLGRPFVADDGLALRRTAEGPWHCLHGPPLLRLWPGGLRERLGMAPEGLDRVHGSADKRRLPVATREQPSPPPSGLPLAAVYVLRRRSGGDGPVRVAGFEPREALLRLVEHGVAAAPAAALGLAARRLELLADLAETVPVRQLEFPSGTDSAADVLDAIQRELEPG